VRLLALPAASLMGRRGRQRDTGYMTAFWDSSDIKHSSIEFFYKILLMVLVELFLIHSNLAQDSKHFHRPSLENQLPEHC
jgi:hypothetical protein